MNKLETILDELIKEAQQNPEWTAEQALRCTKKELLKEQEPKVMTMEQLSALPIDTPVFIEENNGECGWNVFYGIDEENDVCFCRFQARPVFYPSKSYGKSWRCWTSRPTDEQREAMKWNE